ncbi:glycosyltransferase [Leucobacter sp. OH1287]|uniref:glycosyltransferase n=1 Tax=Leucobacter sp. OH1287 TaxID=2491049 RepID=UPI000F5EF702|nr:glycosyltransferase [Leucobacter sp. OH1287]RRD61850.1 glycosyltransferase [Leucobacter sp. OH1287]
MTGICFDRDEITITSKPAPLLKDALKDIAAHSPQQQLGRIRPLFIHAHPDDESLQAGALTAAATTAGITVGVVTCTRGEAGEFIAGSLSSADELVPTRLAELSCALTKLGVTEHFFLGEPSCGGSPETRYRDSGMKWVTPTIAGPDTSAENSKGTLFAADIADAAADIVAIAKRFQATEIVCYDSHGSYGHPDHVKAHHIAKHAAKILSLPFTEIASPGVKSDPAHFTELSFPEMLEQTRDALSCYRTQLRVGETSVIHVGGQEQRIATDYQLRSYSPGEPDGSVKQRIAMITVHTSPLANPGSADAGGMNVMVKETAIALAARGWQVDLVTRKDHPELPEFASVAPGVTAHFLDAGPWETVAKSQAESLLEPFAKAFTTWLKTIAPDTTVVHTHHWFSGVACLPAAKQHGALTAHSYHSVAAPPGAAISLGEQPESSGRIAGEQFCADNADLILAVSNTEKQTIIDRYGADPGKIKIVMPGVDTALFSPVDHRESRSGAAHATTAQTAAHAAAHAAAPNPEAAQVRAPEIVFAGRMQPLKAPDFALRVLAHIPERIRPKLTMIGAFSKDYEWYEQELKQLSDSLGVAAWVNWAGAKNREELARALCRADLLINPSYSETYGIINLESAACGTPVIAHRSSGMRESVKDLADYLSGRDAIALAAAAQKSGQCNVCPTGSLLENRDPESWAAEIELYLSSPDLLKSVGRTARRAALSRSWEQVAAELADALQAEPDQR